MDSNEMEHKPAILNKRVVIIASYNSTMVILPSSDGLTGIAQQPLRRRKKPLRRRKNFHTVECMRSILRSTVDGRFSVCQKKCMRLSDECGESTYEKSYAQI